MLTVYETRGVRIVCTMIVAWRIRRRRWPRGGTGSARCVRRGEGVDAVVGGMGVWTEGREQVACGS